MLKSLKFDKYPDKICLVRAKRGFDFLGYHITPTSIKPLAASVSRRDKKVARLYGQEKSDTSNKHIGLRLGRWLLWATASVAISGTALAGPGTNDDRTYSDCEVETGLIQDNGFDTSLLGPSTNPFGELIPRRFPLDSISRDTDTSSLSYLPGLSLYLFESYGARLDPHPSSLTDLSDEPRPQPGQCFQSGIQLGGGPDGESCFYTYEMHAGNGTYCRTNFSVGSDILNSACGPTPTECAVPATGSTLTLEKTVLNNNVGTAAPTDWTLSATGGTTTISGSHGDTAITDVNVPAGTYTLAESDGPSGYTQVSLICNGVDRDPTNGLTLRTGENVTCAFVNRYDEAAATLTLQKTVVNNTGTATPTDWTLIATDGFTTTISGLHGQMAITSASVPPGTYILSESGGPSGYATVGLTCDGTDTVPADGLTLVAGEVVTCIFSNEEVEPPIVTPPEITPPNEGQSSVYPSAVADIVTATGSGRITIDALANDKGTGLTLNTPNAWSLKGGNVALVNNQLTYKPKADFNGQDKIWYTFEDNQGRSNFGVIIITVSGNSSKNSPYPKALQDNITTTTSKATVINVLANDTGVGLVLNAPNVWSLKGGRVSLKSNRLTYISKSGFTGNDKIWYVFKDAQGRSNSGQVNITVTSGSTKAFPVATPDYYSTAKNTGKNLNILANDTGSGKKAINALYQYTAKGGTTYKTPEGQVWYTPKTGFTGEDNFWYVMTDSLGRKNSTQVKITVGK